ncbi:hypothetical protein LTR56_002203 [Elasticomyces elasticus]|nr:hypothetical protein LTR56_002203 [Elasticomyces elasticus]KAK3666083.1 hypothetical protein LTR22_003086 [Elasticomyces elasticus]KAK4929570.1 hypothetical protein LTR49_003865 [Elasticomyces elasticus]
MPPDHRRMPGKASVTGANYDADPQWRKKPLTPSQLLVNDVRLESLRSHGEPMLEVAERTASSLVPATATNTSSAAYIRATDAARNAIEKQRFASLEEDYGWMRNLRLSNRQKHVYDSEDSAKTRWVHCSSKFPELVSVPFLDWTILGATPPLRFQYFYRLEDTADREHSQVFAKHKPWATNRELDLKVRQWYGHYPTGLNVDELWVLVVDAEHICTFSSNQTWKSRWPALQLSSRIEEVSFRGMRNSFFTSETQQEYTSLKHLIVSLSGAVDRYAGHLSHLQYRLHRAPSTKLVMDLIACQEELNVVIQITQQQIDMLVSLQALLESNTGPQPTSQQASPVSQRPISAGYRGYAEMDAWTAPRHRATYRQISASQLSDPMAQVLDNLQRELVDLHDLRDNTDRLVTRTIQLVNIRLEDHGKAILVFTVVTIVFLPLNFVSSFFGMNFVDIRNMDRTQGLFWLVAVCVTFGVVAASLFLAFSGGDILEKLIMWRDARRERQVSTTTVLRQNSSLGEQTFRVFGVERE